MKNKSIFSFKSIVIFVFCFVLLGSLVLSLSLPKKVSGDVSEPVGGWDSLETNATSFDVGDTEDHGDDWLDIPDEAEIGDSFTGSSGVTYELQEENISQEEEDYYNSNGLDASGVWVEVPTGHGNDGDGTPPPPVTPVTPVSPVTPVTPVSPPQYRCMQCRCQ